MSFHFDNTSDDDEGEIDLDEYDDTGLLALSSRQSAVAATTAQKSSASSLTPNENNYLNGSEASDHDEDLSDVDWEDADDHESNENSEVEDFFEKKLPSPNFPSRGVTVTFSSVSNTPAEEHDHAADRSHALQGAEEPSKKRKRSTVRVLRDVPHHTQQLILGVRRSHLLCCAARSMRCSSTCSLGVEKTKDGGCAFTPTDNEVKYLLMHVSHSLVPMQFHSTCSDTPNQSYANLSAPKQKYNIPSNQLVRDFSQWFFQFVNAAERRRNAIRRNVAQGASAAAATGGASPVASRTRRPRRTDNLNHSASKRQRNTRANKAEDNNIADSDAGNSFGGYQTRSNIPSAKNLITKLMYLSPYYDDDPQLFLDEGVDVIQVAENITPLEKSLLFLLMIRSLGWRARYVSAFDPLPLQLTVDHPLLECNASTTPRAINTTTSWRQLFPVMQNTVRMMSEGGLFEYPDSAKPAKKSIIDAVDLVSSSDDDAKSTINNKKKHRKVQNCITSARSSEEMQLENCRREQSLSWVEVLCADNAEESKQRTVINKKQSPRIQPNQKVKWVSIIPEERSYDKPLDVELILGRLQEHASQNTTIHKNGKRSTNYRSVKSPKFSKPKPVSYVLAVEHFQSSDSNSLVRFTDVTPRYANSWSQTLRLRGAMGKEIAQGGGKCVDEWWEGSLEAINRQYRCKASSKTHLQSRNVGSTPAKRQTKIESPIHVKKSLTHSGQEVEVLEIDSSEDDVPSRPSGDESNGDDVEHAETEEFTDTIKKEPIPTSKAAFKQHPQYVIPSVLNSQDVLHPDARKHICGVFKGELIYRRKDVSKALKAKQWLYRGRKVKENELNNPVKKVKVRKRRASAGFQALASYVSGPNEESLPTKYNDEDDEGVDMDNLYGVWQTKPWSPPPVGPNDELPVNEYKNIELALLNPGLTHMEQPRLSVVARRLDIPYAPCMIGYEGHKGNRTPSVKGIVVHNHNVELLNEAYFEYESQQVEAEVEARRRDILKKWKRLVVGILTKDRIDREYS
eukprot:CCRYP_012947-RA/>CCRYP_012947-RA protein AED:0.02 eAED:0.02 QI:271/1/1/1/1/1/3/1134/1019